MIIDIIILMLGLSLLLFSADRMIHYSDIIAKYFRLSPMLVGITIVALGTSAPEFIITIFAAFNNPPNTDAIIGNVIGSNIANILLILGFAGLFFNLSLKNISKKDIFYLGIVSFYFISIFFIEERVTTYQLFGFFFLVILYIHYIKNFNSNEIISSNIKFSSRIYVLLFFSFIGLFFGGKIFLDKSLNIFLSLGISEAIIGISILAIGTSLPELITVGISYIKKKGDIGVGNIIGSNMMNILFVFLPGVLITNLRGYDFVLSSINSNYLLILLFATLAIIIMTYFKIVLSRLIALIFLISYISYIYWILI